MGVSNLSLIFGLILLHVMIFISQCECRPDPSTSGRHLLKLVSVPPTLVTYHNGLTLSSRPETSSSPIYLIWYGDFSDSQKSIVRDFFTSFQSSSLQTPSVSSWWKPLQAYVDSRGSSIPSEIHLEAEISDSSCSKGKSLNKLDLEDLVVGSVRDGLFPADAHGFYLLLTAEDVSVEGFCRSSCGSHASTRPVVETQDKHLVFGWVGNSVKQCAGRCAWPYARPDFGNQMSPPLLAPNGDVGMDGLIINVAAILAGGFTNPFGNGYYQGDAGAPLEAATACSGVYGPGAFPGFPGELSRDVITGVSFNAFGANDRRSFYSQMTGILTPDASDLCAREKSWIYNVLIS
ncbi:hypothetical protein R1sor_023267 [Riccia sorocarpa]|uniref:Uncharacterized protein n=1 Tax=Riccia sorocarpa TaxID=122646 RepID=A0ABD3GNZ7_9MARC